MLLIIGNAKSDERCPATHRWKYKDPIVEGHSPLSTRDGVKKTKVLVLGIHLWVAL